MPASLQAKLEALAKGFAAKAPAAALELMTRTTRELVESGQAERATTVGDVAPEFELPDSSGALVSSRELLSRGPLVLTFFRGHW